MTVSDGGIPSGNGSSDPPGSSESSGNVELAVAALEAAGNRRNAIDQMLWQVPALSLTAQSFLLTIALGSGERIGRVIASLLASFAAFAAIQLLLKHRYHELSYSRALEKLELENGLPPIHATSATLISWAWPGGIHDWDRPASRWRIPTRIRKLLIKQQSFLVWTLTLTVFAIVDLGIAVAVSLNGL